MSKKTSTIPVNQFGGEVDSGVFIERIQFEDLPDFEEWGQAERHDRHSFFLLEKGTVTIEIDFQIYKIKSPSIIYMHPDQVHRVLAFTGVTVTTWGINNEQLNTQYLKLLQDITPAKPLPLNRGSFALISDAVSLCIKFSELGNDTSHHLLLRDGCNLLVALLASLYLQQSGSAGTQSRAEIVARSFREVLEHNYTTLKRPAEYAQKLNISTSYLNECVKNATGYPVTYHIQQRIILEAKRLLYHSDRSVKEIAAELGIDDHRYFSRLFAKVAGKTAVSFRNKNHD